MLYHITVSYPTTLLIVYIYWITLHQKGISNQQLFCEFRDVIKFFQTNNNFGYNLKKILVDCHQKPCLKYITL